MAGRPQKVATPDTWRAGRNGERRGSAVSALAAHQPVKPQVTAEDSDLERRVLAHERILQALIAHMAEAEPKFLARLNAVFVDTMQLSRREHDYKDTDSYAEQFIREVTRLGEKSVGSPVVHEQPQASLDDVPPLEVAGPRGNATTLFQVKCRTGIWEVTQDGTFYGDYAAEAHALAAAQAAARVIQAGGGVAEVSRSTQR
jgi:hypothetical protein